MRVPPGHATSRRSEVFRFPVNEGKYASSLKLRGWTYLLTGLSAPSLASTKWIKKEHQCLTTKLAGVCGARPGVVLLIVGRMASQELLWQVPVEL